MSVKYSAAYEQLDSACHMRVLEHAHVSMCTVEPLYYGHPWDQLQCPDYWGCPHFRGEIVHMHMSWDQKVMSLLVRCPYFRGPD